MSGRRLLYGAFLSDMWLDSRYSTDVNSSEQERIVFSFALLHCIATPLRSSYNEEHVLITARSIM